jgi:hypothetical protein
LFIRIPRRARSARVRANHWLVGKGAPPVQSSAAARLLHTLIIALTVRRDEMDQRVSLAATFEGEFCDVARSCAAKGVAVRAAAITSPLTAK